ncbi:MAG TPA: alkene reductase [Thermoanaerobaculia bacterium]|jgi:N-ethylmaleimide reductase|nr:alkene reductase [Thermoanaerobaculia bacterium]
MSETHPTLMSPVEVGPYTLKNRLVMAPMTRNRAGEGNVPTPLVVTYYRQRASAGLIVTEGTQVSPQGVGYPGTPGIHSDEQVAGWRRVTDAVHAEGGRIFLQLWHVGRISDPSLQPGGGLPVAPSALAAEGLFRTVTGTQPFVTPRALELAEIPGVVAQFTDGAERALAAGFDGVEIHGANGYLLDQFLRDGSNRRTDVYGGPVEQRARFLLEVVEAVVRVWGPERVGVRLSPLSAFNGMSDSDPQATFGHAAAALARFGLAYLHAVLPGSDDPASAAHAMARHLRERFAGPFVLNGGYTRETGEAAVASGLADLVSFGTLFLANPDLPERFSLGVPLNAPDRKTFYGGGEQGYTDYPTRHQAVA